MRVRLEDGSREFMLEASPLGRGGEASIYPIQGHADLVAKIAHQPTAEQADKLTAMLAAPPPSVRGADTHVAIAWPLGRLLASGDGVDGTVIGYLMPRVHHALPICDFYNPAARARQCPLFHYGYLLRTARNLVTAVRSLHEAGYVIGDLNESNVLVSRSALITLVDTDSFQVRTQDRIFRCRVGKPDFTPPELQGSSFADQDRMPEQDNFAIAVLIFQLLMQGVHPFAGTYPAGGEPPSIADRIVAGHWAYAWDLSEGCQPLPHAPPWWVLPAAVQDLMWRCFEDGHASPFLRPSAWEWQQVLEEAEKQLTVCTINEQHRVAHGLDVCPWCVMDEEQGRDPFPSPEEVKERLARAVARRSARVSQAAVVMPSTEPIREDTDPPASPNPEPVPVQSSWIEGVLVRLGGVLEQPTWTIWIAAALLASILGMVWTLYFHLTAKP